MTQLLGCIKKELLELVRRNRLLVYVGITVLVIALSAFMSYMIAEIGANEGLDMMTITMSQMSTALMAVYFLFPLILMNAGSIPKEIKNKQLIIPLSNGMSSKAIVGAKMIVIGACSFIIPLIGGLICSIFDISVFDVKIPFEELFFNSITISFYMLFLVILSLSISVLTKRMLWAAIIPLLLLMVISSIFTVTPELLNFAYYTPFAFYFYPMGSTISGGVSVTQWCVATAVTVVIMVLLIYFAVTKKNIQSVV